MVVKIQTIFFVDAYSGQYFENKSGKRLTLCKAKFVAHPLFACCRNPLRDAFGIPSGFYKRLAAYLERKSNGLLQSLTLSILTQLLLWLLHVKSLPITILNH